MSVQNPDNVCTKQDLADFYTAIRPYLAGFSSDNGGGSDTLAGLDDVSLSSPTNNQVLKYDATANKWVNGNGGGSSATVLTQTLTAGSTSVTFTGIPTTGDNLIDFFATTGINYTAIDTSTAGQVTLTYEAQPTNVTVYCRIEEI